MKTKSKELREQAAAKFKEANDYLEGTGKDDWEALEEAQQTEFNVLLKAAKDLDTEFMKSMEGEAGVGTLQERMSFYHEKATGRRIGFQPYEGYEPPKSMGQSFVESENYKKLIESGVLKSDSAGFNSGPVPMERKAATDIISTVVGQGSGAANLVMPEYGPWPLPMPAPPMVVRDLFSQGNIGSDLLIYAQQTRRDSGVATVAQAAAVDGVGTAGGLKPQSSIGFEPAQAAVTNIATWMAATRQSLQDTGVMMSMIDNQGRLMVNLFVDDALMNGNGVGTNIDGIRNQAIQDLNLAATNADNLDGIRTTRRLVHTGFARAVADSIVLNPVDSEMFDLLKDGNNQYRGGNPIGGNAYGTSIWGLRRVESEAIPAGKGLVGAFKFGATVLQRTPLQVFTTDSHADFFIRNLIVILFEERLAFPVWWPDAFVEVNFTDWEDGSGS